MRKTANEPDPIPSCENQGNKTLIPDPTHWRTGHHRNSVLLGLDVIVLEAKVALHHRGVVWVYN